MFFCRIIIIKKFSEAFIDPVLRIAFFDLLSTAIKRVNSSNERNELIEVSKREFSALLKRALIDVGTFVSPSAEVYYHGMCDLLEWYSKLFDLKLFEGFP